MPAVPLGFLRGLVGAIGIGCGYMLGRSFVAVRKGQVRVSRMYSWIFRTMLCLLAVWYPMRGGVDGVDIVVWALAAAAFAGGVWDGSRVRKQEDLTHEIFPESDQDQDRPEKGQHPV
jgi:hypothetical protein